ncbi:DUF3488 and transglutaminase-like domain-containing protein [Actinoplanes sp. NBC_00393]|uniref:DUF3488 and transglutaminase-like domain-containing protein n=1 Tax=Actinoplanes sp. NBC_00393 TaxID=2975953 RepID=UPI002E1F8E97
MTRWLRAATVPVALAGMLTLAGAVLGRIYSDDLLLQLTAGAAAASVATGVMARRLPSWTAAPISALLLAGYTILAVHLAAPAGITAAVFRDAVANGIPRLLTALIPVESTPDTVVAPVVAVWLTGLTAMEIVVRGERVLLGCLPPAVLYAAALYVVGPNAGPATGFSLAFAGLVAAALIGGAPASPPASAGLPARVRAHALITAAAGMAAMLALVVVAGPWVSRQVAAIPADPRRYVEPPRVDNLDEGPLNRISGWALTPDQPLLEFRPAPASGSSPSRPAVGSPSDRTAGGGLSDPTSAGDLSERLAADSAQSDGEQVRLRLAVLPDYDGVTWRVGGLYRNAGRVLPDQPALPGATFTDAGQEITVTGLTGRLLPAIPAPVTVSGARVAYDAGTGTLIRPEGLTSGLRYTATSRVQTPDLNLLPIAEAPSGDAVARYLTVGAGVPAPIQRLAEHLADGNGGAYDRAVAIEEFIAEHYRAVADAPSGHAYPNLTHFLFGRAEQGGRAGTSEQFAAAYALLARLTGLPSRIVVGFAAPAAGGAVTGGDALAWPEVLFDGLGWVAFDPMPKSDEARPVEEDFALQPTTPPPTPSDPPTASETPSAEGSSTPVALPAGKGSPALAVAGGAGGSALVVAVTGALAVVRMRQIRRRRRLFTGDPGDRITGAWLELTDALRLAGRPLPAHLSATEAAEFAAALPSPAHRGALLRRAAPLWLRNAGRSATADPPAANSEGEPAGQGGSEPVGHGEGVPVAGAGVLTVTEDREFEEVREPLPPLDGLVAAVNVAGFAPGRADPAQVDGATTEVLAFCAALRRRRPWWARLWWSVRPGPLRWHR